MMQYFFLQSVCFLNWFRGSRCCTMFDADQQQGFLHIFITNMVLI